MDEVLLVVERLLLSAMVDEVLLELASAVPELVEALPVELSALVLSAELLVTCVLAPLLFARESTALLVPAAGSVESQAAPRSTVGTW